MKILWHYTIGLKLAAILESGEIKVATAGVSSGEKPAVWFSLNQVWEETARKGTFDDEGQVVGLDREQTHEYGGGLVRIAVAPEAAPHNWQAFKRLSGVTAKTARHLYNTAISLGSKPSEWFVSFDAVQREKWLAIEVWDGEQWKPYRE